VTALHGAGYRVLVASTDGEHGPADLPTVAPVAVVFGNEHAGVSAELRTLCDGTYAVPMRGFVESLNVSVAAAITMFAAPRPVVSPAAAERILAEFLWRTIPQSAQIVTEFTGGGGGD
jgi:tRNA (guanosine-2'-O-)-methyltransferase